MPPPTISFSFTPSGGEEPPPLPSAPATRTLRSPGAELLRRGGGGGTGGGCGGGIAAGGAPAAAAAEAAEGDTGTSDAQQNGCMGRAGSAPVAARAVDRRRGGGRGSGYLKFFFQFCAGNGRS
jgi:hypothetical protein